MRQKVAWTRFWGPFGENLLGDDDGYLFDPNDEFGTKLNPRVVTLPALADVRCLALLGDAGMGKSIEIDSEVARLRAAGEAVEKIDLALFTDEARLLQETFESEPVATWRAGTSVLTIFLDALDESLVNVRTFGPNLLERLRSLPVDRLRLRIACRSADWPRLFDEGLDDAFTTDHMARYELLPLRRADAELAARQAGLDVEGFFGALDRTEAHSLATRPLTLDMLVKTAGSRGGELPSSRIDLFDRAVRKLSAEHDQLYARDAWRFDAAQRLAAAARIAAASLLCGRARMISNDDDALGEGQLNANLLSGGTEFCSGSPLQITQPLIEETLRSALFTGAAIGTVTWSHRAIAEYLTATWLVANGIVGERAIPLLFHAADDRKVVPQLRGVASWLASLDRGTLERLATVDPLLLLGADAPAIDDAGRAAAVAGLLAQMDALEAHDGAVGLRHRYAKLAHPGLDVQLRPYISDETKNPVVRRVAIDIAEACNVRTLEDVLVTLALDRGAHYGARQQAVSALAKIGSADARSRLRPLLRAPEEDAEDELLGYSLRTLWPATLTTEELFTALRPRQRPHYFGMYAAFLGGLSERLANADIAIAAAWAAEHATVFRDQEIIRQITSRARGLLGDASVRASYARLVAHALQDHPTTAPDGFDALDAVTRRAVLPLVLEHMPDDWRLSGFLRLLADGDLVWLASLLNTALVPVVRARLIRSVREVLGYHLEAADLDAILTAAEGHVDLAVAIAPQIEAVEIDSDRAMKLRASHAQFVKFSAPRAEPLLDPPPRERVRIALDQLEAGDLDAFWHLARELTLRPDSRFYEGETHTRLVAEPGWAEADETTRSRIVEGARRYLEGRDAEPDAWLGKSVLHYPALGGYRALHLLADVEPGRLDELTSDVWRRWAPAILGLRSILSARDATFFDFARRSYSNAPRETLNTLMRVLEIEDRQHRQLFVGDVLDLLWDLRLERALRVRLGGRTLHAETVRDILTHLLRHDAPGALDICERMLRDACRAGGVAPRWIGRRAPTRRRPRWRRAGTSRVRTSRRLAVVVCEALFEGRPKEGWAFVWRRLIHDERFGRDVMLHVATRADLRSDTWLSALTETRVADFHLWMRRVFPRDGDPVIHGGHAVSPREAAGMLRDRLVRHLRDRKTLAARDALKRIAELTGDKSFLLHAADAEAIALADTWAPAAVADLLALAAQREARLVASGAHLLDVVVAALRRVDARLQGELPQVQFLWDVQPDGALRPKDEGAFSDFVAARLEEDLRSRGVIINREVQIRSRRGGRPGERTDIHVDAVVPNTRERLRVIIEAKGNWNDELETAIGAQLADRYLAENECRHGVYLVGWFHSANWDPSDGRRRAAGRRQLGAIRADLERQAAARSSGAQRLEVVIMNTCM